MSGGPIIAVKEGDTVPIDIPNRRLDMVGVEGAKRGMKRLHRFNPPSLVFNEGLLALYARLATSGAKRWIY